MRQNWWRRALRQESVSPLLVYVVSVKLPRRFGKNSTTIPGTLALLCLCAFLSFFSGSRFILGGKLGPMPHTSLPCKLGSYPSCLYLTEFCWTCLAPLFLFSCRILAVGLPGITSVASAHSSSTWSRALSWASVCHVLHDASRASWILFNRIVFPLMLSMDW